MRWLACSVPAVALLAFAGCATPPPVPTGPALAAPPAQDLLPEKALAFQAGMAAGERLQARRDAAALTSAHAALAAAAAVSACPSPAPPKAPPPAAPALAVTPQPGAPPVPSYAPGGPAVPVAPAN